MIYGWFLDTLKMAILVLLVVGFIAILLPHNDGTDV